MILKCKSDRAQAFYQSSNIYQLSLSLLFPCISYSPLNTAAVLKSAWNVICGETICN